MRDLQNPPMTQTANGKRIDWAKWVEDDEPLALRESTVEDRRDTRDPQELGESLLNERQYFKGMPFSQVCDKVFFAL